MLKIEKFVKEQFGITLTSKQLEIIALISTGQVKITANLDPKVYGNDIVQKSVLAYLQDGLTEVKGE